MGATESPAGKRVVTRIRPGVAAAVMAVACVAAGATLTLARYAWWATGVVTYRGVHPAREQFLDREWVRFREQGKVEVPDPGWRPVRVSMVLAPSTGAPAGRTRVVFSIDDRRVHDVSVGPEPTPVSFVVERPGAQRGVLALQLGSEGVDDSGLGVALSEISVQRVWSARAVWRGLLPGGALGALLWFTWWWPRQRQSLVSNHPAARAPASEWKHVLAAWIVSAALFGAWAVLKPPMQAPDEFVHVTRALASPLVPWLANTSDVPIRERDWNPLALTPVLLLDLPFHPQKQLSREQLRELRATPWPDGPGTRHVFTQAWSYPPGFYWVAYAGGSAVTALTGASPYGSTYAYRLVIALLAAAGWAWVFGSLRHAGYTPGQRWFALAVCIGNPMVAFLSSSVSPDALHDPLVAVAIVSGGLALSEGRRRGELFVALALASLVKFSAVMMAALLGAGVTLVLLRRLSWRDAADRLRPVVAVGVLSYFGVAMWNPLVMYGTPMVLNLGDYWERLTSLGWHRWVSFWGRPGWLDYEAPDVYYVAIAWILLVAAVLALPRLVRAWRRAPFAPVVTLVCVALVALTLAGEYAYLQRAGLTFQGRYVLPIMVGVAVLLLSSWRPARWAFLIVLLALHIALVRQSVVRYYGDVDTWKASLPWAVAK